MTSDSLEVDVHGHADVTMIALRGDLDVTTVPDLDRTIETTIGELADLVIIDAGELDFAGVRGVTALTHHAERLRRRGHRVVVLNLAESIRRTVDLLFTDTRDPVDPGR